MIVTAPQIPVVTMALLGLKRGGGRYSGNDVNTNVRFAHQIPLPYLLETRIRPMTTPTVMATINARDVHARSGQSEGKL